MRCNFPSSLPLVCIKRWCWYTHFSMLHSKNSLCEINSLSLLTDKDWSGMASALRNKGGSGLGQSTWGKRVDPTVETALRKMYGLAWEAALRNSSGSGKSNSSFQPHYYAIPWGVIVDVAELTILRKKVDWKGKQPWIKPVDLAGAAALQNEGGSGSGSSLER